MLSRYASVFSAVEINSSFYRPHQLATYRRWAESTPDDFRFSVKIPKSISHEARLVDCQQQFNLFFQAASELREKLDCLLLQLPPSFAFDGSVEPFLRQVREQFVGALAIEPRHPSWWAEEVAGIVESSDAVLVAADPAPRGVSSQALLTTLPFRYLRLHGSPEVYWSTYSGSFLKDLAVALRAAPGTVWCIFDNTASGAASANALAVRDLLISNI